MIEWSRELMEGVLRRFEPYAIVAMVSGGKDSMAAYQLMKVVGVPVTHILHGVTGTGVVETTEFVREFAAGEGVQYIEADAGNIYEVRVRRKGFFGRGRHAHSQAYHLLKHQPFARAISRNIRQRRHGRVVLLVNGVRREESTNRSVNFADPIKVDAHTKSNVWVNILNEWTKQQRGAWLDNLESEVLAAHALGWGEEKPRHRGKQAELPVFQPMCTDCLRG